jgi:hypothetical protein
MKRNLLTYIAISYTNGITTFLKLFVLALTGLFLISCIDEYSPEIKGYQNLVVVDGKITSGPGPFEVNLSLSTNLQLPEYTPLRGCVVEIRDDAGGVLPLKEVAEGRYVSPGQGEEGIPGRAYKLSFETSSGKRYETDFETMPQPVLIDSVYPRTETKQDPDYDYDLIGYQFYIDTREATGEKTYYLWQLEQTYQYNSDFFIHFYFDDGLFPFNPIDSLFTCWLTENINEIIVFGTENLSSPSLTKYPLNFVSTETRALSIRYSLLTNQFTLNESAYYFWKDIYEQNAGETSLYTQQYYQIRGNVKNISNEDEPVLGYFLVAGKDSKRIFVNRNQDILDFNYPVCELTEDDFEAFGYIYWTDKHTWPLYVVRFAGGGRALPQAICTDCRERGGTIIKPDFWIDQ